MRTRRRTDDNDNAAAAIISANKLSAARCSDTYLPTAL